MNLDDEERYTNAEDYRIEQLKVQAKDSVDNNTYIQAMKKKIDRDIERYDEYLDSYLNDFPQHVIDELKYKIGE
jgi:hypothetical protein